jgi:hypothetical protein
LADQARIPFHLEDDRHFPPAESSSHNAVAGEQNRPANRIFVWDFWFAANNLRECAMLKRLGDGGLLGPGTRPSRDLSG